MKYIIVGRDHFSGKAWARMISRRDANTAATFLKNIIEEVGFAPTIVHTDNGGEFYGEFDQAVIESGAKHIWSTPYHPQSNGGVERFNGILKGGIDSLMATRPSLSYRNAMPEALVLYNNRHSTVCKRTHNEIWDIGLLFNKTFYERERASISTERIQNGLAARSSILELKAKKSAVDRRKRESCSRSTKNPPW